MLILTVSFLLLAHVTNSEVVSSVPIRVLDPEEKSRLSGASYYGYQNSASIPVKSYIIYDEDVEHSRSKLYRNPPNWQIGYNRFTQRGKPTVAYQSVYSNTIQVYQDPALGYEKNHFYEEKPYKLYTGNPGSPTNNIGWRPPPQPVPNYDVEYPYEYNRENLIYNQKIPNNFPKIFSPNTGYNVIHPAVDKPQQMFYPNSGLYQTHTVNYPTDYQNDRKYLLQSGSNPAPNYLCSFVRRNNQGYPEINEPCARNDEYFDYSNLPNDKLPMEHRRPIIYRKRRSADRKKRSAGYGFNTWRNEYYTPYTYGQGSYYYQQPYDQSRRFDSDYFRNGYRNRAYNYNYNRDNYNYNRDRYNNRQNLHDFDEDYQSSEETNNRGLVSFLTNGGRRDKSRRTNRDEDDDMEDSSEEDEGREMSRRRESSSSRRNEEENKNRLNNKKNYNSSEEESEEDHRDHQGSGYRRRNNRKRNRDYNNGSRVRGSYNYGNGNGSGNYGSYGSGMGSNGRTYDRDFDRQGRPISFNG